MRSPGTLGLPEAQDWASTLPQCLSLVSDGLHSCGWAGKASESHRGLRPRWDNVS